MKSFIRSKLAKHRVFLGNVSVVMLANVVKIVLGVVLIPVYVRYVSPADLGKFDLIMSFVPILNQIISLGMTNSIGKFYLQDHDTAYLGYVRDALLRHTLWVAGGLFAAYWLFYPLTHPFLGPFTALLALSLLVLENLTFVQFKLYSLHEDFKKNSVVSVTKDLLRYTSLILLVMFMEDKLTALFLGNLVSWLYLYLQSRKDSRPYLADAPSLSAERIEELKKYSYPLLFLGLSGFFYLSLDRIMVGMLADSIDQVGYLGIAQRFTTILSVALGSIGTVLGIRMFKTPDMERLRTIQERYLLFLAAIVGVTLLCYLFFKEEVIRYLLTQRYEAAFPIGIFLLMTLYWNKSRENLEYYFLVEGTTALLTGIFVTFTLLNMVLNIFFILRYEALGAVLATNITFFLHTVVLLKIVRSKGHRIRFLPFWIGAVSNLVAAAYLYLQ